jgi:CDP-4-dehydro-6-deoxyglucose reductase
LQDHPDLSPFAIYAAGPPAMIDAVVRDFSAHGAQPQRLYLDSFDYATDP